MKNIFSVIVIFILNVIKSAFWAALFSGVFWLLKLLGSLVSFCNKPTLQDFLFGGLALFVLFFLHRMFWIIRDMYRRKKDPVYDKMSNTTGISYKDYKKLRDKNNCQ